jgi:hypothetical protein
MIIKATAPTKQLNEVAIRIGARMWEGAARPWPAPPAVGEPESLSFNLFMAGSLIAKILHYECLFKTLKTRKWRFLRPRERSGLWGVMRQINSEGAGLGLSNLRIIDQNGEQKLLM